MPEPFTEVLAGGHHNSLGRTDEVVGIVLDDHDRLEELYAALESTDELFERCCSWLCRPLRNHSAKAPCRPAEADREARIAPGRDR